MKHLKWTKLKWVSFSFLAIFSMGISIGISHWAHSSANETSSIHLKAVWAAGDGATQDLKTWQLPELTSLKKVSTREKDPTTGRLMKWQGVLISSLVDQALGGLSLEKQASVDLIVLKSRAGQTAFIPRALIVKYPLYLAFQNNSKDGASFSGGGIHSVVPWTSKPRILSEDLPLNNFYISDITEIELANYRNRFTSFFLKRRTDPSAIRGEKLFVQNCTNCHFNRNPHEGIFTSLSSMKGEAEVKKFEEHGHPVRALASQFNERVRRSIIRYLEAHRMENSQAPSSRSIQ